MDLIFLKNHQHTPSTHAPKCSSATLVLNQEVFLVGTFRIKEPDYCSHSFFVFLQDRLECDEIFVLFVQLNKHLGHISKSVQRVPSHFSFQT